MRIEVTADDIETGVPCSHTDCPVAMAIRRKTGHRVRVSEDRIENPDGGRVVTTPRVQRFIEAFDSDRHRVRPFAFDLPDDFLPPREAGGA